MLQDLGLGTRRSGVLPSHARRNGSLPIPCMGGLKYRCSVSLLNKSLSLSLSLHTFMKMRTRHLTTAGITALVTILNFLLIEYFPVRFSHIERHSDDISTGISRCMPLCQHLADSRPRESNHHKDHSDGHNCCPSHLAHSDFLRDFLAAEVGTNFTQTSWLRKWGPMSSLRVGKTR